MTYIILAAGKGQGLYPLTLNYPKTSYKLDEETTVLQYAVRSIRKYDRNAEIVVVIGYLANKIQEELENDNVIFIKNPFYETTNSIASIWFARDYLERENVTIIHGDVIFDEFLTQNYLVKSTSYPYVLVDKSIHNPGAYNVVTRNSQVLVMSRKLESFNARYCCMTKLDAVSARLVKKEIDSMINNNMYSLYFEDAMVQMVMFRNFNLFYVDVNGHQWREVDSVDDLLIAQSIHKI